MCLAGSSRASLARLCSRRLDGQQPVCRPRSRRVCSGLARLARRMVPPRGREGPHFCAGRPVARPRRRRLPHRPALSRLMRIRWTTDAADDLERICDFIAESSPDATRRVAKTIVDGVLSLTAFPNRGRLGRVEGTREFVFAALLFVAVYEVHDEVRVLRVLHGAHRGPCRDGWCHSTTRHGQR